MVQRIIEYFTIIAFTDNMKHSKRKQCIAFNHHFFLGFSHSVKQHRHVYFIRTGWSILMQLVNMRHFMLAF